MGRLSFSSLFDKIELHAVGTAYLVKCKLINNYEQCIAKVSRGTGCKEDVEMRVQILSFLDILRDECKDSCPYMAYKNAPEVPEAFEDSKKDWADSDPYWYDSRENSEV